MAAKKKVETKPELRSVLPKTESGVIDWRKIVSKKNILLNRNNFAKNGIDVDQLTEDEVNRLKDESPDKDVMISLGGFES